MILNIYLDNLLPFKGLNQNIFTKGVYRPRITPITKAIGLSLHIVCWNACEGIGYTRRQVMSSETEMP